MGKFIKELVYALIDMAILWGNSALFNFPKFYTSLFSSITSKLFVDFPNHGGPVNWFLLGYGETEHLFSSQYCILFGRLLFCLDSMFIETSLFGK